MQKNSSRILVESGFHIHVCCSIYFFRIYCLFYV